MGESDSELWQALKYAAKNHGADGQRAFRRHTDQPWQPIFGHFFFAHHVPRVDEDGHIQVLTGFENGEKFRSVEVPIVDVGADLNAFESDLFTTTQLLDGQIWRLHGQGA